MNDFILKLLVGLWDRFKAKNATVATVIVLALGTLVYFADQGTLLGVFTLPEWAANALEFLGTLLIALTGSRTTEDLKRLNS